MRWPEGYALKRFDVLDSTNQEARRLAEVGEGGPLWITATCQTAGRGRRGRVWQSGEGNLAATLLLQPAKPQSEWPELSFAAAIAVAETLAGFAPAAVLAVKWPNDVLGNGAKTAGILLEAGKDWLAIGIGINLAEFPPDTEYPATSLAHLGVPTPDADTMLTAVAANFAKWYEVWEVRGFLPVREAWLARASGLGGRIRARLDKEERFGLFNGIDTTGALLLDEGEGRIARIAAADIFPGSLMLLAIDAGNTNTVFAVCEGNDIRAQWRAATNVTRTADEYAVWLAQLLALEGLSFADLTCGIIATVVPATLFDLRALCRHYLKCEPLIVGDPAVKLGIGIHADRPLAVGADRLANSVAAHARYKGAVIVVDFGTATNFDIVAENGDFDGSVIAPGVNLSIEALHQAAALLPRVAIHRATSVIGRDTVPAMQSGIYWGYVGLIEGLIARIKAEYGKPMTVIATGGLAHLFQKDIPAIVHIDPDLTVAGLMLIHALNVTQAG